MLDNTTCGYHLCLVNTYHHGTKLFENITSLLPSALLQVFSTFSSIVVYCGGDYYTIDREIFTLKIICIKNFVVLNFHNSFDPQSL